MNTKITIVALGRAKRVTCAPTGGPDEEFGGVLRYQA